MPQPIPRLIRVLADRRMPELLIGITGTAAVALGLATWTDREGRA